MENSFIIDNLLQQEEGIRLEFRAAFNIKAIARTITAFINTKGGDMVLGINEKKEILGINNAEQIASYIQGYLVEHIQPLAPILTQAIPYNDKMVILISVWEGSKKPYQFEDVIFDRRGTTTIETKQSKLPVLIKQRKDADFHWERMPVLGAELDELDNAEIKKTIDLYTTYKERNILDEEDFLIQTGLIQNGCITNACMVLFGKAPVKYIPQSRIRITLYPGTKSGDQFLDDKIFDGHIFRNIESVFQYLELTFGKTLTVNGLKRTEKVNYPVLAIREGILNAIVHRDYNSVRGFLQISVYSDRTEVTNYGSLPNGITVDDLKVEHISILRNPDIAQICFYRKYIEMLGSGTLRMIRDCKEQKFKTPVWKVKDNIVTVVFPGVSHNRIARVDNKKPEISVNTIVEEVIEGVARDFTDLVKQRLVKMLLFIERNKGTKVQDISSQFKVSERTAKENLRVLVESGLVEYIGSKKAGSYSLTKELHDKLP